MIVHIEQLAIEVKWHSEVLSKVLSVIVGCLAGPRLPILVLTPWICTTSFAEEMSRNVTTDIH